MVPRARQGDRVVASNGTVASPVDAALVCSAIAAAFDVDWHPLLVGPLV